MALATKVTNGGTMSDVHNAPLGIVGSGGGVSGSSRMIELDVRLCKSGYLRLFRGRFLDDLHLG